MVPNLICKDLKITENLITFWKWYSNPKSFVNFLLPPQGIGEGWGGVKIYDSCKDCYIALGWVVKYNL